jgi:integrase
MRARVANHYPTDPFRTVSEEVFSEVRASCLALIDDERRALLLSKNVNQKVVQEMLGHATITQTMDTYSHVLPTMQDAATEAMESTLS